jgi:hypothetical protein
MGKTNGLRALDAAHLLIKLIRDVVENLPPQAPGGLRRQITDSAIRSRHSLPKGSVAGRRRSE